MAFESPERGRIEVGITRLHLEEDAGKLMHDRFPGKTAVDLNRAGIPLAEIVSEPDLRSPAEARAYLVTLRQILVYAGVSDCSMEQGSLRVDANISIRRPGETRLGTKTEVKNLNSFANVERALEAERDAADRRCSSGGERVEQVTLLFNAATRPGPAHSGPRRRATTTGTSPIPTSRRWCWTTDWIAEQRGGLPELPEARRARLETTLRPLGLRRPRPHQRGRRWPSTSRRWSARGSSPRPPPTGSWATS